MNFKGHVIGGAVTSTIVSAISLIPIIPFIEISRPEVLFFVCFFMSLFPDFDTASIPQRWFYRILLVLLFWLYLEQKDEIIAIIAIFSITPLIHKHRGWTHWKVTPFIISLSLIYLYDYEKGVTGLDPYYIFINYLLFILAVVSGHYTHLLLDSKLFKNEKGHH